MISAQTLCVCREGKPLRTFPDHALDVFGEAVRTDFGGRVIRDEVGLGVLDVQEVGTEDEGRDHFALQLGELRGGLLPLRERVDPDDVGGPCANLEGEPSAESLKTS